MTDRRLHVLGANRHGQSAYLLLLDGEEFATVRDRRIVGIPSFFSPHVEISPPPRGRSWNLPLQELMAAAADVRMRLRVRTGDQSYTVGDVRMIDRSIALDICFGDGMEAVVHKRENRTKVHFPLKGVRPGFWRMSLHDAESALCDALRALYDVERMTIPDAMRCEFTVVSTKSKVDALIMGNKWTDVQWQGGEWCLRIFERSDFRPWNLPYEAVVAVLAEMQSHLADKARTTRPSHGRDTSLQAIREHRTIYVKSSLRVAASPYREWVTVPLFDGSGIDEWAELHHEGPELQLTIFPRGDGRCWELPLTHTLDRLHEAKELLIGDAERAPVRRPVIVPFDVRLGTFWSEDGADAMVDIEPIVRGFALRHGGREFATVAHGSPPLLEVHERTDGCGWTLPLVRTMDVLEEGRVLLGLGADGAGHRRHVVTCTEAATQGAVVEIRFENGLRAEMRRRGDDMQVHVGGGAAATRELPLSEVLAAFRWGLAVLHAAGPPTEANFGDFFVVSRSEGVDVLVAGVRWVGVTVEDGEEPRMELFGREDLRPWRLPCDAVVDVLTDVRRRLSGDDPPGETIFSGRESLGDRKGALDHRLGVPSDRDSDVVVFSFRDEDCWVQWAELNEGGPELQLEMFAWPGRPMSGVPLREVIERLRHGKTLLFGQQG